jgi:hypothetical protein
MFILLHRQNAKQQQDENKPLHVNILTQFAEMCLNAVP